MVKQNNDNQYFLVLEQKSKSTITIPIEKSPVFNNLEEWFKNRPMSLASICAFTIQFANAASLKSHLIDKQLIPDFEDNIHYASVLTTTNFSIVDQIGTPITNTPIFGTYAQQMDFPINDPVSFIEKLFNSRLVEIERYTEYLIKILNLIKSHLDHEWRKYTLTSLSQRHSVCKRLEEYIKLINSSSITSEAWDTFNNKLPKDIDFDSFVSLSIKQLIFNTYYDRIANYADSNFDDLDWEVILIILGFDIKFQKEQEQKKKPKPQVKTRKPKLPTSEEDDSEDQLSFF